MEALLSLTQRPMPPQRGPALALVLLAHLALGWALLQNTTVRQAVAKAVPLMVTLIVETPATPPQPSAPLRPAPMASPSTPLPEPTRRAATAPPVAPAVPAPPPLAVPATPDIPAPPAPMAALPAEVAAVVAPAAAPAAPPSPAPPPSPPAPRVLTGSAVRYLVAPPLEVPLASRRLNEAGTVLLKVLVGTDGLPRHISVQKSSGHARLDAAALAAMGQARFKPLVEDGVALECIVLAPLQFELD